MPSQFIHPPIPEQTACENLRQRPPSAVRAGEPRAGELPLGSSVAGHDSVNLSIGRVLPGSVGPFDLWQAVLMVARIFQWAIFAPGLTLLAVSLLSAQAATGGRCLWRFTSHRGRVAAGNHAAANARGFCLGAGRPVALYAQARDRFRLGPERRPLPRDAGGAADHRSL